MSNSADKWKLSFEPYVAEKKVVSSDFSVNENVKKFYTINIPSLMIETCVDQATASPINILPNDKSIYCMNLIAYKQGLPPRLRGRIPKLDASELATQEEDWNSLMKNSHRSSTVGLMWEDVKAVVSPVQQLLNKSRCAMYSLDVCATPGCGRPIPVSKQSDHLNLCDEHRSELDTVLKNYQKSYSIVVPENMSADDVHNMVYYNLLPSIDQLLHKLLPSTDKHQKYVVQVLLALKACIYLYRMHLNAMPRFIQIIIDLFLNALRQCEAEMKQLVSAVLKLVLVPFAICGIFLVWTADLLLSDDRHLSIALMAAGGGLTFWGCATYAAGAVVAGPIAAVAGGIALLGIGASMLIKRWNRHRPHDYAVRAHADLENVRHYLQQWLGNVFQDHQRPQE